jgi:hypothetical protein
MVRVRIDALVERLALPRAHPLSDTCVQTDSELALINPRFFSDLGCRGLLRRMAECAVTVSCHLVWPRLSQLQPIALFSVLGCRGRTPCRTRELGLILWPLLRFGVLGVVLCDQRSCGVLSSFAWLCCLGV